MKIEVRNRNGDLVWEMEAPGFVVGYERQGIDSLPMIKIRALDERKRMYDEKKKMDFTANDHTFIFAEK